MMYLQRRRPGVLVPPSAAGMTVTSVPDLTAMAASEISCNNGRKRSSVLRWPCNGSVGFGSGEQRPEAARATSRACASNVQRPDFIGLLRFEPVNIYI